MLLFDPLPERHTHYEESLYEIPLLPTVPHYQSSQAVPTKLKIYSETKSTRGRFIRLASCTDWSNQATQLRDMPLKICATQVLHEWTSIVSNTEHLLRELAHETLPDDAHITRMVKQGVYVRESLDMLQELSNLIRKDGSRRHSDPGVDAGAEDHLFTDLERTVQSLISRTQDHVTRFDRQLAITASFIGIEESRTSIRLAKEIG